MGDVVDLNAAKSASVKADEPTITLKNDQGREVAFTLDAFLQGLISHWDKESAKILFYCTVSIHVHKAIKKSADDAVILPPPTQMHEIISSNAEAKETIKFYLNFFTTLYNHSVSNPEILNSIAEVFQPYAVTYENSIKLLTETVTPSAPSETVASSSAPENTPEQKAALQSFLATMDKALAIIRANQHSLEKLIPANSP